VLELDPNFAAGRWGLARSFDGKGITETAIAYAQEAVRLSPGVSFFVADLGHALAVAGRTSEAIAILNQLLEESNRRYVDSCNLAHIYAGLCEKEKAIEWLERAFTEHSPYMTYANVDPWFDPLRSDPRFQNLLRRMSLPT